MKLQTVREWMGDNHAPPATVAAGAPFSEVVASITEGRKGAAAGTVVGVTAGSPTYPGAALLAVAPAVVSLVLVALALLTVSCSGGDQASAEAEKTPEEVREGLRVSLSELGKSMSAKPDKNEDIDNSDLPKAIKDLLKMIRELRAQIVEKQAQIEAIMSDQSLDAETKRQQLDGQQGEGRQHE